MSVFPGYADRVGPQMAFDKVVDLAFSPISPETDKDLTTIFESLKASYPDHKETQAAIRVIEEKRPDIAVQYMQVVPT